MFRRYLFLFALALSFASCAAGAQNVDAITFGDKASEQGHVLTEVRSEVFRGGLGESARRLLPLAPVSFNGGSVTFRLKVDPEQQNYFTVKLWGADKDAARGRLILYIDGLQVGYRHEGDYDVLNQTDEDPIYQGRFLYQTMVLPLSHTHGKSEVEFTIAGLGPMWPYGTSFSQMQKNLTEPTRGIYRAYTHTATRFLPDPSETEGSCPSLKLRGNGGGEELLSRMGGTVNNRLNSLMSGSSKVASAEDAMLLLAVAYDTPWAVAYKKDSAVAALVEQGDAFLQSGKLETGNWVGAGPFGEAIARLGQNPALMKALEKKIDVPSDLPNNLIHDPHEQVPNTGTPGATVKMTRREAWAKVLRASIDVHRFMGRRFYTNQSMLVDFNIYAANRGLMILDPAQALPEKQAMRYVYEAIGLLPWLGNDTADGKSERPYGSDYYLITKKGLSRELGFVGTYGETILKFSRDIAELSGDEKVREQLIKIETARMNFRYPSVDPDGFEAMKVTGEIDNRTAHFPVANGAYAGADVRELWWMEVPAFTKDRVSVGAAQQSLEDGQYFYRLAQRAKDSDTLGMMRNISNYAMVKALPESSFRLPMSEGQPDTIFADPEDAVIALKHGEQRLFVNFYFRQEYGVSGATRILEVMPDVLRVATVQSQFEVVASGQEWKRPDVIDFERSGGFTPPGPKIHQAFAGEKLPVSKRPEDAREPAYGSWGPFVGKAAFYWLRYGDYLFAINTTADHTYKLPAPEGFKDAKDLVSGKTVAFAGDLTVGPATALVLYLGK